MKLKPVFFLLLLGCITFASIGCSRDSSAPEQKETANENIVLPQEEPALTGIVKEIIGNEVTIYKMAARPNSPETDSPQDQPASDSAVSTQDQKPGTEDAPTPNAANQKQARPGMQPSEETETFTIPVGTPIVSMNGDASSTVSLTDIKENQLINVWKTEEDISMVQVIAGREERQENQQEQGAMPMPPGEPGMGAPGSAGLNRGTGGNR